VAQARRLEMELMFVLRARWVPASDVLKPLITYVPDHCCRPVVSLLPWTHHWAFHRAQSDDRFLWQRTSSGYYWGPSSPDGRSRLSLRCCCGCRARYQTGPRPSMPQQIWARFGRTCFAAGAPARGLYLRM